MTNRAPKAPTDPKVAELERRVEFLWDMVVFLADHPHYRIADYLKEKGL